MEKWPRQSLREDVKGLKIAGIKMICPILIISKVFKIAIQAFNMLNIRSKMKCWASGE